MVPRLNGPSEGKRAGFSGFLQTPQRHNLQQSRRWFAGNHFCAGGNLSVSYRSGTHCACLVLRSQVEACLSVHSSDLTPFHPGRCHFILGEMNRNGEIKTVVDDKLMHKVFNLDDVLL